MLLHHHGIPIESMAAWAAAVAGPVLGRWKPGNPGHDLARAWCPEGRAPGLPAELEALLIETPGELGRVEVLRAEPQALTRETPGAVVRMEARSKRGLVAVRVLGWGDAPFGSRVETELRTAVQSIARDVDTDKVETIRYLARTLLAPTPEEPVGGAAVPNPTPALEPLGALRWELLRQIGEARTQALEAGMECALFVLHEIVSLGGTRESRRRNNREDLDRFVRRLSGGTIPRLQRGVVSGPVALPGVQLYLGKVRRDLP
ncbi:MAG: hypothetical protein EA422_00060 [Gemmatimonadales bacterium]|nr:MAG: hypothetical protein EA422_00060 [Gemmatimonadales bacterium]